jgi:hypothetical protein
MSLQPVERNSNAESPLERVLSRLNGVKQHNGYFAGIKLRPK